jgi:tRNA A37 threonylcarbamoyladenosine dehydratase
MNEELMTRFKDAPFITEHPLDIIVIGAGGISSWAALFLSRLQHNLYVYDFDSFEVYFINLIAAVPC